MNESNEWMNEYNEWMNEWMNEWEFNDHLNFYWNHCRLFIAFIHATFPTPEKIQKQQKLL